MSLRKQLYHFCKEHDLEDMACIVQLALVNYATANPTKNEWVYLSPKILNSYMGIGEEKIVKLLEYLADKEPTAIKRSYQFFCPNFEVERKHCDTASDEDFDEGEVELVCDACGEVHTIDEKSKCEYEVDFEGNRKKIVDELRLTSDELAKELVVLNTNEEHMERIAQMLVDRLQVSGAQKREAKNVIYRMLASVKDISGLIAGISEDVATTTSSIKKVAEDLSLVSTLKEIIGL